MKKYSTPECNLLTLDVGGILNTSTGISADYYLNIKKPTWNTDGDYGLE